MTEQADTKRAPLDQRDEKILRLSEEKRALTERCKKLEASNASLSRDRERLALRAIEAERALDQAIDAADEQAEEFF